MGSAEWTTVSLGDVATLDGESVRVEATQEYTLAGVRIAGRGLFWRATIRGSETNYASLRRLRTGQLVMRKLTAWEGPITTVPPEFAGAFVSSEFPTFTLDESRLLPAYMRVICQWPAFHAEMRLRSTGTAERRSRLDPEGLLSVTLDLPPLSMQRQIAALVSVADDAAVAARLERDAAFDVLAAVRERLLVPLGTWASLPVGWELKELGEVADVRSGITKGRRTNDPVEAAPFLRVANVQDGYLDLSEMKTIEVTAKERARFRLFPGDVLMTEGGNAEHLGRGWMWTGDVDECIHQNHVFRARPDLELMEPRFLAYAIAASPARAYCFDKAKKTVNLASINKTQITALPLPVPTLAEQRQIVSELDAIRAVAANAQRLFESLEIVHKSLIDSLVSGKQLITAGVSTPELVTLA